MAESNREFGDLLTQGLKSIAARERKALLALQDELGHEIGVSRHAIEKWRQGHVPSPQKVAFLARTCVCRSGMDRQWLLRFLTQARFPGKEALTAELLPEGDETVPAVRHNLPRRPYERFIGRDKELADLRRFLSPRHRVGVVSISGIAGVGKTALALEIAHRLCEEYATLPPDERFEAIVWVTAKRIELLPTGPTARRPTFGDLDGLYLALAEVLDRPAITRATTREEQEVIVARTLAKQRALLVLDNLEDVDDPALMVFLRDLPAPSKVIVTTRHRIDVAVPTHLHILNQAEARELIRSECHRHHLTLTGEQSEKLLRRTGGLPLAIVRTLGRIAWRGSSVEMELRQLGDPTGDIYDFCFDKSITLIRGKDAHRLFMALAIFAADASREALGHVAGFGEDILSRDEGLSDLEVLSLVNKDRDRFSLEPMTKIRAQAEVSANLHFEQEALERRLEWYREFIEQHQEPADYPALRQEAANIIGLVVWLEQEGRMEEFARVFSQMREYFYADGLWEPLLSLARQIVKWAESAGQQELLVGNLKSILGIFHKRGDYEAAAEWIERAEIAATHSGDQTLLAEVLLARGRHLHRLGHFSESVEALSRALNIFQQHSQVIGMLWAVNSLGNAFLREMQYAEARSYYLKGLDILEEYEDEAPTPSQWRTTFTGNLGITAGRRGNHSEARELLYDILNDLTDQTDFAEAYITLAVLEHKLGNDEQAQWLGRRVEHIIARLGLARPICEEDAEWMRLYGQDVSPPSK